MDMDRLGEKDQKRKPDLSEISGEAVKFLEKQIG
jgi:hypothetical protein